MNIIQDYRVHDKYFASISSEFSRNIADITEIVCHGTAGGQSAKGIIKWMLSGEREEEYKKGIALFHYEIDRNGDIYQIIPDLNWVYHSSSGRHDKKTIGIELVNPVIENKGKYTIDQYNSLFSLIKRMMQLYPIDHIAGHGGNKLKYSGSYKNCPGEFDWVLLKRNFNISMETKEIYKLKNDGDGNG
jgi:N-acetyl-anhydromuramyl-L-alanine amidase AmpD